MTPWSVVVRALRAAPPGTEVVLGLDEVPSPESAGMRRSTGLPRGQLADWRVQLVEDGSGLHVRAHRVHYVAHLDRVDPSTSLPMHVMRDVLPALFRRAPSPVE